MKKIIAIVLAFVMLFSLTACGSESTFKPADGGGNNNTTKPSDDGGNNNTAKPADEGENKNAPRFTGLDGETEGDASIQKWAQNCSVAYRYSQLIGDEKEYTVWTDAVQICCLNYFYYCGYTANGYERMRAGNPDYAVPDNHYAVIVDGDSITYYDFALKIKATGEAWDYASCWGFELEDIGSSVMLCKSIHRDNWLAYHKNDQYFDTRIDELPDKTIAGRTCKGFNEIEITRSEAFGDFEDVRYTIYYDPETGLGLDCINHDLTTAFVFDKVEFNCVTPDDVKAVIEEQKKGITFTEMTLDEYTNFKAGY